MVSRRFSRGSRLVCILNVNKHPFEEINYGTGKEVHDETIADAGAPLEIRWLNGSYLKIPVFRETEAFRPATVFLVRHAEKAAQPAGDPPLLESGLKRSSDLARILKKSGIRAVYASQYLRTRQTAEPLETVGGTGHRCAGQDEPDESARAVEGIDRGRGEHIPAPRRKRPHRRSQQRFPRSSGRSAGTSCRSSTTLV